MIPFVNKNVKEDPIKLCHGIINLSIYLSTCELFARVEEVGYPGVVSLLLLEQPFLGNLLVALKPMI